MRRESCFRPEWILAAALTLAAGGAQAATAECGKQLLFASVTMTPTRANVMTIPISINGTEQKMLLDTGGSVSQLSRKAMTELGLRDTESPLEIYGVDGSMSRSRASVNEISIGLL